MCLKVHESGDTFMLGFLNLEEARVPVMNVWAMEYALFAVEAEVVLTVRLDVKDLCWGRWKL